MKPKEITINKSLTLNLGNYQSARIEASLTTELEPGENWASAAIRLGAMVGTIINAEAQPVIDVLRTAERQAVEALLNSSFAPATAPLAVSTNTGSVIPLDGDGDFADDDDLDETEEEWADDDWGSLDNDDDGGSDDSDDLRADDSEDDKAFGFDEDDLVLVSKRKPAPAPTTTVGDIPF